MQVSGLSTTSAASLNSLFAASAGRARVDPASKVSAGAGGADGGAFEILGETSESLTRAREGDSVELSPAASVRQQQITSEPTTEANQREASAGSADEVGPDGEPLTSEQVEEVRQLRDRDQEVKTHEQAHVAAAGSLFKGGPYYTYQQGPDGKRYAVGGSVEIDTSTGRTPEETLQRASQIKRAALAPAEPSSTDRSVAAKADRMAAQAKQEISERDNADAADRSSSGDDQEDTAVTTTADGDTNSKRSQVSEALSAYASTSAGAAESLGGGLDVSG